jgi:hypothetical protein
MTRRRILIWLSVLVLGSGVGWLAQVRGQERVKVEVTVPAVPNIGPVAPGQAPSELAGAPRGVVYVGYRGAYHLAGAGHEGHAMFRDANNQFWANSLTYYGMSNGYWMASVNGAPDTYLAFQAKPLSDDAPYYKELIHTPAMSGYAAFDEATRGNPVNTQ